MVAAIGCIPQTLLQITNEQLFGSWRKDSSFMKTHPRKNNSKRSDVEGLRPKYRTWDAPAPNKFQKADFLVF